MSTSKKKASGAVVLLNYSKYEYADKMPPFCEQDRLQETDLSSLVCYHSHQPEGKLNDFTDATLNDHLYRIFLKKSLKSPKLMRKLTIFFVRRYKNLLYKKARDYLESKKLTLDEWLHSVAMNRRGDILCVFLLSMVTGRHACIHLKEGRMWSTLRSVPVDHDEHVNLCDLHLVYLGFGAFLRLIPRPALITEEGDLPILGYVVAEDPKTQMELTRRAIKEEKIDEPTETNIVTAAAGSASQLSRVERELNMPQTMFSSSNPTDKPEGTSHNLLVLCKPLSVKVTRLSNLEMEKYQGGASKPKSSDTSSMRACSVKMWKLNLRQGQSVHLNQFNQSNWDQGSVLQKPVCKSTPIRRKRVIKRVHIFNVQSHVLKRRHLKAYLKCRVPGCCMAYVTFNSVRSISAHHLLHHPSVTYRCPKCTKVALTPNSLRLHMYCHEDKQFQCEVCRKKFVYQSKLKQHKCMHTIMKKYECFHGGCNKKYKHPQDLIRHILIHQDKSYECDFCDKKFAEKRLLKRHTVIHLKITPYKCEKCNKGFKHNNQLYRHKKKC